MAFRSSTVWLALLLAALAAAHSGCGGSSKGPSLQQQYQEALQTPDPALRSRRLAAVAEKQQQGRDGLGADASLSAARQAAASVAEPASRAQALTHLAGYYVRLEQSPREVQGLLKDAAKAADQIADADARVPVLADLATATGRHLQSGDAAAEHLRAAESAAASIQLPLLKVAALARVSRAWHAIERPAESERVVAQALELARELEDPRQRADCLAEIAATLGAMQQADAAAMLAEARAAAEAISADDSRAYALLNLAAKAKAAGRGDEARQFLAKAEDLAHQVRDASIRNPLLDDIHAARRTQ